MKKRLLALPVAAILAVSLCGGSTRASSAQSPASLKIIQVHLVQTALKFQGVPYADPSEDNPANTPGMGFSDVGFVDYVYQQVGVTLPSQLVGMTQQGKTLKRGQLRPGDLVFFQNTTWAGLSHVGIYLGHGTFIHAEYFGVGVRVSSFRNDEKDGNYWHQHFLFGVRAWSQMVPVITVSTGGRP